MLETALVDAPSAEVLESDSNETWVEALPARIYHTPQYGEVPVTIPKLERFIANHKNNVRGIDVATDFEHGMDTAKGKQASGWYRDFELRPSSDDPTQTSLWAKIEFTDDAKADIKAGKWKYWSTEWDDEYFADDGTIVPDVVIGGGLTNRPIAKKTMPINFSEELWNELDEDTRKEFAVLSSAQRKALPRSAFLYVENDGTTHLPYKHKDGSIDLVHLRAAITRLSQGATGTVQGKSWLSDSLRASLLAKARRILASNKKASELIEEMPDEPSKEWVRDSLMQLSEAAAWEHSDPGIAVPLYASADGQPDPGVGIMVPRVTGDVSQTDPAVAGGWRREPLGVLNPSQTEPQDIQEAREGTNVHMSEGGRTKLSVQLSDEQLTELVGLVESDEDDADKFMEVAKKQFSELSEFKKTVGQSQQERQFSEQFPDVWREHQALLENNRSTAAKSFSESVSRINKVKATGDDGSVTYEPTRNGLSGLALETVAEAHKKFSEGTGTLEDFENAVKAITNGGVVEFGEVGSATEPEQHDIDSTTATGIAAARKLFAEKVAEVQAETKDGKTPFSEYSAAIAEAGRRYPDLAEAYRATAA